MPGKSDLEDYETVKRVPPTRSSSISARRESVAELQEKVGRNSNSMLRGNDTKEQDSSLDENADVNSNVRVRSSARNLEMSSGRAFISSQSGTGALAPARMSSVREVGASASSAASGTLKTKEW